MVGNCLESQLTAFHVTVQEMASLPNAFLIMLWVGGMSGWLKKAWGVLAPLRLKAQSVLILCVSDTISH